MGYLYQKGHLKMVTLGTGALLQLLSLAKVKTRYFFALCQHYYLMIQKNYVVLYLNSQ